MITKYKIFESIDDISIIKWAKYGDLIKVAECIKNGEINETDYNNETALFYSVSEDYSDIDIFNLLISSPDIDVNIQNNSMLETALFCAPWTQTIEMIKCGANWNLKNVDGETFVDKMNKPSQQRLKKLFPYKYRQYIKLKKSDIFNL
jgi:ankyrin repeat protein